MHRQEPADFLPPTSADIGRRQNTGHALRLLIAQRRLYTRAKRWQGLRWCGLLLVGIGGPFVTLMIPGFATAAGALAGGWLFIGRTGLSWLVTRAMAKGACVQEEFDRYLFQMPVVIFRAERPTPEDIELLVGTGDVLETATKEKLLDWYPIDPEAPPLITISVAQRANASYSDRLIRMTVVAWATTAALWVVALVAWASLVDLSLSQFLLGALFPVLPAFLDVVDYIGTTWKSAKDRSDLASTIAAKLTPPAVISTSDLLVWQETLFDLRRTAPQVPDWLYWLTRKRNERAMKAAATRFTQP